MPATHAPFVRDRATWLLYLLLSYYAYMQAVLAPAINFLGDELELNFSLRGVHVTAFAIGMVAAGLFGERVGRRFGRGFTVWAGSAGMGVGGVLLTAAPNPVISILAAALMGVVGSFALVMIQSLLSDRHGQNRASALTESNVAAIIFAALAPLAVGTAGGSALGWRVALFAGVVALALLAAVGRTVRLEPEARPSEPASASSAKAQSRLPGLFWLYWLVVFFGVGVEWSVIFWSGAFLEAVVGLSTADATLATTAFFVAMTIGRIVGSRLVRTADGGRLLVISLALALWGLTMFWLGPLPDINLFGLFVAGLGVANIYPLALSVTTGLAPDAVDIASARTSMASGSAILIAPLVLGSLADQVGIQNALGVTAVLALLSLSAAVTGLRGRLVKA